MAGPERTDEPGRSDGPCTALVTGAGGFVGGHLVAALLREGWRVWTLDRVGSTPEGAACVRADLRDEAAVRAALETARPDVIFHLAAQSSVPASFRVPRATLETNVLGAANLLYAAADLRPMPRVVVIGSAEEYGPVRPEDMPIDETQPLAPRSPYGVSKAAQSLLALSAVASHGLPAFVLRPFNHTGPGQRPDFAVPSFARQIARIEAGLDPPVLRVGNLDARRDFTDVRDVARAYVLAAERARPGEVYNLGSGDAVGIRWVLDALLGLSGVRVEVRPDPERMTPAQIPELRADASKFRDTTGWAPAIPLEQTLADVLDAWRDRIRRGEDDA